jgi:hypothetical protein
MANFTTTGSDTFPAGHVLQTVVSTKTDENSATMTSTTWDKVRDGAGNAEFGATINNVGASNYVLIMMDFVAYQYNGDANDGGSWGIMRESTLINGHSGGHGAYVGQTSTSIVWYTPIHLTWLDTSPGTGTNNYYLAWRKYHLGGMVVRSTWSSEAKFQCVLQEIKV